MKIKTIFLIISFMMFSCSQNVDKSFIRFTNCYIANKTKNNLKFTEEGERFFDGVYSTFQLHLITHNSFMDSAFEEEVLDFKKKLLKGVHKAVCLLESKGNEKILKILKNFNIANYMNFLIKIVSDNVTKSDFEFLSFKFSDEENNLFKISFYEKLVLREVEGILQNEPYISEFCIPNTSFCNAGGEYSNVRESEKKYFEHQKFETPPKGIKLIVNSLSSSDRKTYDWYNESSVVRSKKNSISLFPSKSICKSISSKNENSDEDKMISSSYRKINFSDRPSSAVRVNTDIVGGKLSRKKNFDVGSSRKKIVVQNLCDVELERNKGEERGFKDFVRSKFKSKK